MAGAGPQVSFAAAHAQGETDAEWGRLALDCVTQLGPAADRAELGFLYVTDALAAHLPNIVALLRQSTGVKTWAGSVGVGIAASGAEYFDCPAMAVLVASLPNDAWRLIPNLERDAGPLAAVKQFMADNNAVIMMVVLLLLGAKLLGDGLADF